MIDSLGVGRVRFRALFATPPETGASRRPVVDIPNANSAGGAFDVLYYFFICVRRLGLLGVYPGLSWKGPPELQNCPPRARGYYRGKF